MMHFDMGATMKNKWVIVLAGAGAAVMLFFGGMFAVNTVFASEQRAAAESGLPGTQLHALAGTEAKKAYKKEVYGDLGCTVVLPDGYVPSGDIKGMYLSERNPLDSSNIYYTASENVDGEALDKMLGSDEYKKRMEEKLKETYGQQAAVDRFQYAKTEVSGCPAHKVELSCKAGETEMDQLIYIIIADKVYTVTYSQSADDERMEEFRKSAETIRLVFAQDFM